MGGVSFPDLVVHYTLRLSIIQRRDCEAASIFWIRRKIDLAEVSVCWMKRVWADILSRKGFVGSHKSPTYGRHKKQELILAMYAIR